MRLSKIAHIGNCDCEAWAGLKINAQVLQRVECGQGASGLSATLDRTECISAQE